MFSILRLFARIAATPKMAPTIANVMITMMMAQSTGDRAIDAATRRNGRIFVAYIVVLLVTAVVISVFTWLTWDSGNKLQDAIRQDANARIEEAKQGVKQLEKDNLRLGGDLADAKAAQQRVETDLAKQQIRAAKAETDLLELQQRIAPRRVSSEQRTKFLESFEIRKNLHNQHIRVSSLSGVPDGEDFANDLAKLFEAAGYTGVEVEPPSFKIDMPKGIQVIFGTNRATEAEAIAHSLRKAHIQIPPLDAIMTNDNPEHLFVFVGMKLPSN
jgi:hypothetical protein